jgi:glycerol-3-phosphate dehydrogenase
MGFSVLLLEQKDFAWGTSSRSSKMVHGGLRYLKQGKLLLTRASVKERERLLADYPGLVEPLGFIMPVYRGHGPSRATMGIGLSLYSLMAMKKQHQGLTRNQTRSALPFVNHENLTGGFMFTDAQVDDARLVLQVIGQGCALGGSAFNYTRVCSVDRTAGGRVVGVTARQAETNRCYTVKAPVVINATGVFAEQLHPSPEPGLHLRPLRGSHLIFPGDLLPVNRVVSFVHPRDQRPVFISPWKGCAVLGTTDVDHDQGLAQEPCIQKHEVEYLMEGAAFALPGLHLDPDRCIAAMAGVRPVLSRRRTKASNESREHVVWQDQGLVTVTGGKLTTFRLLAADAIRSAMPFLPRSQGKKQGPPGEICPGRPVKAPPGQWQGDIAHAAAHEGVHHLSDLLLRRTRLGILLPQGGRAILNEVGSICSPLLGWDEQRWNQEQKAYLKLWDRFYSPPGRLC